MINIDLEWESLARYRCGDFKHAMGIPVCIDTKRFMEMRALMIAHKHRGKDGEEEELHPIFIQS